MSAGSTSPLKSFQQLTKRQPAPLVRLVSAAVVRAHTVLLVATVMSIAEGMLRKRAVHRLNSGLDLAALAGGNQSLRRFVAFLMYALFCDAMQQIVMHTCSTLALWDLSSS
jgi:hypothetical protein